MSLGRIVASIALGLVAASCSDQFTVAPGATVGGGGPGGDGGGANGGGGSGGGHGGDGGGAPGCGLFDEDCILCLKGPCGDDLAECDVEPECSALATCYGCCTGEGKAACQDQCELDHPSEHAMLALLTDCAAEQCDDECTPEPKWDLSSCSECTASKCSAQWNACAASAPCRELGKCLGECEDDDACVNACYEAHAEGSGLLVALVSCSCDLCGADAGCACPAGNDGGGGTGGTISSDGGGGRL